MLLQLNIINFALIEKLSISFQDGFNVLSGETGAGKSILIDAINYVLGGKFTKEIIRTGTNKTFVEAVFSISNPKTIKILEEYEIEFEDLVIISRETFETGKSIVKVNGKSILVSALKVLSQTLLDIHGQHENVGLLDSSNHIDYLDSFGGEKMQSLLAEYRIGYNTLVDLEKISGFRKKD
jgi:ATPase involved in DNA repair